IGLPLVSAHYSSCSYRKAEYFFLTQPSTTDTYPLSLHDALPIFGHLAKRRRVECGAHPGRDGVDAGEERHLRLGEAHEMGEVDRSEEHTSELQSPYDLVCRLLLEKKKRQWSATWAASASSPTWAR